MLMVCAAGCGEAKPNPAPDSDYAKALAMMAEMPLHGKSVKKIESSNSYLENNINIEDVYVENDNIDEYSHYIEISGLKDKEVQAKINKKIEDTFYEMGNNLSLPNILGIKIKEKKYAEENAVYKNSVSAYARYNYNNVLGVMISKSTAVVRPDTNDYYYSARELNFDLATGEELTLGDCFADGFDYVTFLNEKLIEYAENNEFDDPVYNPLTYNYLSIGKDFETIWPDMQFYPVEWSNTLTLIFDSSIPGFESLTSPEYFEVKLDQGTAIKQRFATDESLFVDETLNYGLAYAETSPRLADYYRVEETKPLSDITGNPNEEESIYLSAKCPLSAPQTVLDEVQKTVLGYDEFASEARAFYENAVEDAGYFGYGAEDMTTWGRQSTFVTELCDYYTMDVYRNVSTYSSNFDFNRDYSTTIYKTFDKKGKEMRLSDVFKADVNFKDLLIDTIYESFAEDAINTSENYGESTITYIYDCYGEELRDLAETLYEHINGIGLTSSMLELSYDDKEKVIADWIGDIAYEDGGERVRYLCNFFGQSLFYREIGCENLAIF